MKDLRNILDVIGKQYPLKELGAKGFDGMKVKGMTFSINSYNAKGLGHVSTMCAKGFFGLMTMDTLIINPVELDLPLLSYDRIHVASKDKLIAEVYDTMLDVRPIPELSKFGKDYSEYLSAPNVAKNWYDDIRMADECVNLTGKKANRELFDKMILDYVSAYLSAPANAVTDLDAKREKNDIYINGLLENGGVATDMFIQRYGRETTSMFFKEVLFSHS